jgi:hypothetical protein
MSVTLKLLTRQRSEIRDSGLKLVPRQYSLQNPISKKSNTKWGWQSDSSGKALA